MAHDEHSGRVVLFGGENDNGHSADAWAWTGENWAELTMSGAGPNGRRFASMIYAADRRTFLMFGGDVAFNFLAETWDLSVATEPVGDLNCDCSVNAFDIEPFILALFDAKSYKAAYPDCDVTLGDINGDGVTNAFDIEPFIELLFHP